MLPDPTRTSGLPRVTDAVKLSPRYSASHCQFTNLCCCVCNTFINGVIWCDFKFSFLFGVTICSCIYKLHEVAKTKVSKPKRYSLSKLRLVHAPLKRLIQYMSTSWCGEIFITPPKCLRKERVQDFFAVVQSLPQPAPCLGDAVFRCESKSTLFGLPKNDN